MEKFVVTRMITKFGYYVTGIGTILICCVAGGVMARSFLGALAGFLVGGLISIPLLLWCELSYAIIRIAQNTDPLQQNSSTNRSN